MNKKEAEEALLICESNLKRRIQKRKRSFPDSALNRGYIEGLEFALNVLLQFTDKIRSDRDKEMKIASTKVVKWYNVSCRHYCEEDGHPYCAFKMDMEFCGRDCAFARKRGEWND